jgi:hypothetical protein
LTPPHGEAVVQPMVIVDRDDVALQSGGHPVSV